MHFLIHLCSFLVVAAHALCVQTWREMSIILDNTYRFLFFFHSGRHLRYSTINSTEFRKIWQFFGLVDWKRFIWVELSGSKRQLTHFDDSPHRVRHSNLKFTTLHQRCRGIIISEVTILNIALAHFVVIIRLKRHLRRIISYFLFGIPISWIHHGGQKMLIS